VAQNTQKNLNCTQTENTACSLPPSLPRRHDQNEQGFSLPILAYRFHSLQNKGFNIPRLPQPAKFLKRTQNQVDFFKNNDSRPYRAVMKGCSATTTPTAIQEELLALGLAVPIVVPVIA
jgi:hypothetical protein